MLAQSSNYNSPVSDDIESPAYSVLSAVEKNRLKQLKTFMNKHEWTRELDEFL